MATGGRPAEGATTGALVDIREMSFQNVIDQIFKPNGVKVGGFPHEMFVDLTDDEERDYSCDICYMVVNEPRQCVNKHLFCEACIFGWTMTYGENSQRCPKCRVEQKKYDINREVKYKIWDKKVRCPEDKCEFEACVRAFLMHSHGKQRFSNEGVKFEELRPARPDGARLLVLPNITMEGSNRLERAQSIRDQIHQGRLMIHQMMLLLHLEMQLRQQALVSYSQATDPVERLQRLDEVMALNEQLNEVGGVLSTMLNSPITNIIQNPRLSRSDNAAAAAGQSVAAMLRNVREHEGLSDDDDDDDDDASVTSFGSTLGSRLASNFASTGIRRNTQLEPGTLSRINITSRPPSIGPSSRTARDEDIPVIPEGGHLSNFSQAGTPATDIHPRVLLGRSAANDRPSLTNNSQNVVEESTTTINSTTSSSITRASQNGIPNSTVRSSTTALPNISSSSSNTNTTPSQRESQSTGGQQNTTSSSTTPSQNQSAIRNQTNATISRAQPNQETVRPHASTTQNTQAVSSVAARNTQPSRDVPNSQASRQPGTANVSVTRNSPRRAQNGGSASNDNPDSIAATARLLSGRIRAQPQNSLSANNTQPATRNSVTNASSTAAPSVSITWQTASNAGESQTPRVANATAGGANISSQGPVISSAQDFPDDTDSQAPSVATTTTPRFEQRNTFRVSTNSHQSVATRARAGSATRRRTSTITQSSPTRNDTNQRGTNLRYATRIRQNGGDGEATGSRQTRGDADTSVSRTNTNNRVPLTRARDTTNRLSNSYRRNTGDSTNQGTDITARRTVPNSYRRNTEDGTNQGTDTAARKTVPRRASNQNDSNVPRGPTTPGQLIRARRRSEIRFD